MECHKLVKSALKNLCIIPNLIYVTSKKNKIMKRLLILLTMVPFLFTGCKKDSSSGNVTLKYEIVSPSAFAPVFLSGTQLIPPLTVYYINETGQMQTEEINTNASTWSKTIQLTASQRPISILFNYSAYTANASGTGVGRIYVNGVLEASQNIQMTSNPYQGSSFTGATGKFTGYLIHPLF
jgi:hypothetical protein